MKLSQVAKPSTGLILSPTLRIRIRYAALMMLGIGIMLFAVAGSVSKDQAAAVGGWGVGFLLLSVLLGVLNQKFGALRLCSSAIIVHAETLDRGQDIIGRFGPTERLWIGVVVFDECGDRTFESNNTAVDATSDLAFGQERKEPLDLVEPGTACGHQMHVPARPASKPVADQVGLVGRVIIHDQVHMEVRRYCGLDL